MLLYGMIFVAGVLHGLGPDHLAAITAFGAASGGGLRRVSFFALRFAAGHALVICIAGLLASLGRGALPVAWERRFDLAAGSLLIFTGGILLIGLLSGRIRLHSHEHMHGRGLHRHWHFHFRTATKTRHRHQHGTLAVLLGGLFALGGVRSLLLIVPVTLAQTLAFSLLRIAVFATGITLAMVAYGMLASRVFLHAERWSAKSGSAPAGQPPLLVRGVSVATALICIIAGALTVAERLRM